MSRCRHASSAALNNASIPCRSSAEVGIRVVSELCHIPSETPVKHRRLRGHVNAYRGCAKSFIGNALVRFGVVSTRKRDLFPSVLLQPIGHLSVYLRCLCRTSSNEKTAAVVPFIRSQPHPCFVGVCGEAPLGWGHGAVARAAEGGELKEVGPHTFPSAIMRPPTDV